MPPTALVWLPFVGGPHHSSIPTMRCVLLLLVLSGPLVLVFAAAGSAAELPLLQD